MASAAVPSPGIASSAMLLPPTPPVIVQDPPSGGGSQATPTAAMGSSHAAASTDRAGTTAGAIDIDSAVLGGVRVAVAATAAQLTVHFTAARSDTAARIVAAAAQLDAPIAAAGLRLEAVTVATVHADAGTAAFGGGMLDPGTREHRREASSRASRLPMPKGRSGPTASADRFA